MIKLKLFLFLLNALSLSECFNILAIFPMPMHSHYVLGSTIVKELAQRGHNVTVITPFLQKEPVANLNEISVESLHEFFADRKKQLYNLEHQNFMEIVKFFNEMGVALTENTLKHDNVQKLLHSNQHFDLVIVAQFVNEGLLAIAHHFKAPWVLVSTMPLFPWASHLLAHPSPPSYTPNFLSGFTGHMSFWQRVHNTICDSYAIIYNQFVTLPMHRRLVRQYVPNSPDLYAFLNNASMVFVHSDKSIYDARPSVPNAIEIAGAHVKPPKPLPADLKSYLDASTNGAILFSMGTNLKSSDYTPEKLSAVLDTFRNLSENVLWKWESDTPMANQPSNVKLMKWLPQSDILAHRNVKAFITHGGLFSTIESIFNGVPLVGIPIFADQKMNMAAASAQGYAQVVPYGELTKDRLAGALHEILHNPTYRENAKKRSAILRDQPMKPLERTIFWMEYVVRHKGAPHLRYAGMDLAWYQRNLLDVIAFLVLTPTLVFLLLVFAVKRARRAPQKLKSH